jgi:hypothetical protein
MASGSVASLKVHSLSLLENNALKFDKWFKELKQT